MGRHSIPSIITPMMTPVILTSLLNDFSVTPMITPVILTSLLNDFSVEYKLFSKVYNSLLNFFSSNILHLGRFGYFLVVYHCFLIWLLSYGYIIAFCRLPEPS
jgi:hypothetical protein